MPENNDQGLKKALQQLSKDNAGQTALLSEISDELTDIEVNTKDIALSLTKDTLAQAEARKEAIAQKRLDEQKENQKRQKSSAGGGGKDEIAGKEAAKGFWGKLLGGAGGGAGMFLAGLGALMGGGGYLLKQFNDFDGEKFKKNVDSILSITPSITDPKAAAAFVGDSALFLGVMMGIGGGLLAFGVGAGAAGAAQKFVALDAQSIVDNVTTLLSINSLVDDSFLTALGEAGTFVTVMGGIGLGLGFFAGGSAAAGLVDGWTKRGAGEKTWAQSIVDNVTTLLSISDLCDGKLEALKETGTFFLIMSGIAAGLGLFALGSAAAGTVTNVLDVTDWAARGEGMTWSQSIKNHVITLLSIADLPGVKNDTKDFKKVMTGISVGLGAFGIGSFFGATADTMAHWISSTQGEEGSWPERIKAKVSTLLEIVALEGNGEVSKSANFKTTMQNMSDGLKSFAGATFVDSLLSVGTSIFNFLSGDESGIQEMLNIADKADDLQKGADAIGDVQKNLTAISELEFKGNKLKIKAFAKDLMEAVPLIEGALLGSEHVDGGLLDTFYPEWLLGKKSWKGLSDPSMNANYTTAIERLQGLGVIGQAQEATAIAGGGGGSTTDARTYAETHHHYYITDRSDLEDIMLQTQGWNGKPGGGVAGGAGN